MDDCSLSSLDPLEEVIHRTNTHHEHDFGGVSALPESLARHSSWRSRNSRGTNKTRASSFAGTHIAEEEHDDDDDDIVSTPSEEPLAKLQTTRSQQKVRKVALRKVARMFLTQYAILFFAFIAIMSIYWGSWYNRAKYIHNLSYLVVSEEAEQPLITQTLHAVLNSSLAKSYGTFHFKDLQPEENRTVWEEVIHLVHEQRYWAGLYVPANASMSYLQSLKTLDPFNDTIRSVYETGRNPTAVPGYVVAPLGQLEKIFVQLAQNSVVMPLVSQLTSSEYTNLLRNGTQLLSSLWWTATDYRPYTNPGSIGPVQIGLIYCHVMSFHQFNFASATHELVRSRLHLKQYLVYHILSSHLAYCSLGLVYCLMTVAFHFPYDATFGKSGFLVQWACVYLLIAALGGLNENVAIQIFARNKPLIGFWIVFYMVLNLSPVFSPIPIINQVYRYGYAMPMYCGNHLLNVILMDTSKREMGRNIGILVAWNVVTNIILPFNLISVKKYNARVHERAQKALAGKT